MSLAVDILIVEPLRKKLKSYGVARVKEPFSPEFCEFSFADLRYKVRALSHSLIDFFGITNNYAIDQVSSKTLLKRGILKHVENFLFFLFKISYKFFRSYRGLSVL